MYMAKIIVGLAIGQKIMTFFDKKLSMRLSFTIGLILYYILSIIPFIGFVFWIIAGLIGFGALLLQKKYVYTDLRKKRLI